MEVALVSERSTDIFIDFKLVVEAYSGPVLQTLPWKKYFYLSKSSVQDVDVLLGVVTIVGVANS
ncbi:CFF_HP2_G0027940.mRNA.1.CDS.1 [Saccharomyces cerevisiae]|nr:CFF_HP2_G0027940.mRNA.1.CDS.1 [Saccharomyces cerevisiae]CAI6660129.1 CFF_HP2_G0027940.mRNA.1.CDS.1 [Saccharomyces cerevisiae]